MMYEELKEVTCSTSFIVPRRAGSKTLIDSVLMSSQISTLNNKESINGGVNINFPQPVFFTTVSLPEPVP
eukprot:snap_masked-scaffold_2-processed-gene-22.6-mRNA-1 protein AED:1.00 eAED:1.00 QI:0/-1/0/0/-1/1/1/0/69